MEYIDKDNPLWGSLDESKHLPANYKIGRQVSLHLQKIERDLFTDFEEKQSGNYIVKGIERKVNEYDFHAFSIAMAKILYNQSYQSGNEDINSGVKRQKARGLSVRGGKDYYAGSVVVSLNDICREAYGADKPSTEQRKAMTTLIDTLHNNKVHIDFPNGDTLDATLCATMGIYTRKEDGAITYSLTLNPIFCEAVENNFGLLPQDTMKRLALATSKTTAAHLKLLKLLAIQNKRTPFVRYFSELLKEMGLEDAYKANTARTEKQILNIFNAMVKVGIVSTYTTETRQARGKKRIDKVKFILNPDFDKGE